MLGSVFDYDPQVIAKFTRLANNEDVAKSKGSIFHCPTHECLGLIDRGSLKILQRKAKCHVCQKHVCTSCQQRWHKGTQCTKANNEALQWSAVGNVMSQKAHRCPKCRAPFEKDGGCPHMVCMMCQYEWCWYCGMKFDSRLHMWMLPLCGSLGELQNIPCIKKTCPWFSVVLEVSIFFFFPVYYVLLILLVCAVCIFASMDSFCKKFKKMRRQVAG